MSLFEELKRRNVVRVGAAYIVIGWLLAQVAEFAFENFGAPEWVLKTFVVIILLGLPLALFFAWAFELTPEGIKLEKDVDRDSSITHQTGRKLNLVIGAGAVLAVAAVIGLRSVGTDDNEQAADTQVIAETAEAPAPAPSPAPTADSAPEKSIAVLPFVAMTASQDDEFFADGLSEELLNVLAKIEGLKVAGRTSAFYYKGRNEDLREIAEALGVAHILEGSVRRSGNQIRVTAQLIKADDGFHLWSETYDRSDGDTFVIQDEISSAVAEALQTTILGTSETPRVASANSVEAQNLYLIAQAAMARRSLADVRRARDLYGQASVLDPANPAYLAGYAHAVVLQYWNSRDIPFEEAIEESGQAITKALNLGDPDADILAVAGLVQELRALALNEGSAKTKALDYYQQSLRKDADNILALQWLASIYLDINQPQLAREHFEKVVALDPLNTLALTGLANAYFGLGLYDEARQHLFKIQMLFPERSITYRYLSNIEYQTGRIDKASFWVDVAKKYEPAPYEIFFSLYNYVAFGWADKALEGAESYRQSSSDGVDISRLIQARLDFDMSELSKESLLVFEQTGDEDFAALSAWADAIDHRCANAVATLEAQYPSAKGDVIEYVDGSDLINIVLLAHCNDASGNRSEANRIAGALLASDLMSDTALSANPARRITRVAARSVAGDIETAIAELNNIDVDNSTLLISAIALPVDELPVFDAIADHEVFRKYASRERYRVAEQARMLASGETRGEIQAEVKAAGYTLSE